MEDEEETLGFFWGLDVETCFAHPFFKRFQLAPAKGFGVVYGLAEEDAPLLKELADQTLFRQGLFQSLVKPPEDGLGAQLLYAEVPVEVFRGQGNPRSQARKPGEEALERVGIGLHGRFLHPPFPHVPDEDQIAPVKRHTC